ncbi:ATP-dependent helicase [archaeon]|nr:ATP-dependent helicase [archaeon]
MQGSIIFKEKQNTEDELKELLHPLVRKWFFSKFKGFAEVQLYGVYEVHCRNNVLISAPTGGGKTLTAFLSVINELVGLADKGLLEDKVYCIYISPLKALSQDIRVNLVQPLEEMEEICGKKLGIRVCVRTGDTSMNERQKMLKKVPHILITTPESLALMLSSPKFKGNLKSIEWCIVDEIHALADNKRGVHLSLSLERLEHYCAGLCRVGLSATIAPIKEVAGFLVGVQRDCNIINVHFAKKMDLAVLSPVENIIESSYGLLNREFYAMMDKLIQEHRTTLIFTNTRSATERVVHNLKSFFPEHYYDVSEGEQTGVKSLIGAHHGSLSKQHRFMMEQDLREGKLKAVVCSTSLELGIDIGYIDLVLCLGSPKSVVRLLQRTGRSGHRLHDTVKARIIVLDRDDLVECSVMLKQALEHKIDRVKIPRNCLDVLSQQFFGMALADIWDEKELFNLARKSYCYENLEWGDFDDVLAYLAGDYALEERHVYARIWRNEGRIGKRGRMSRMIYMTNIGTIPEQESVIVKNPLGEVIGMIEEVFLEKLKKGDVFVLGGNCYRFEHAKGMVAYARAVEGVKPTVPSWHSESLPLSFDLAEGIGNFRKLMKEKMHLKEEVVKGFIMDYLHVSFVIAGQIYDYFMEQNKFIGIPDKNEIYIEHYKDEEGRKYAIVHSLFGRKVNDALSRAVGFVVGKISKRDAEIGIWDNGFYLRYDKEANVGRALRMLKQENFYKALEMAIERSELLKRRFRYCAGRALMILREYKGRRKYAGRQQVASMILMSAVKRIDENFCILKEAKREAMNDVMDAENALQVIKEIAEGKIKVREVHTAIPSPFALGLIMQGYGDILRMEDRNEFLRRMHLLTKAKIALKED